MRVLLRRTWFAPNGFRYRRFPGGVEIPDEFRKALPSTAVVVGKDEEPKDKNVGGEPVALSQLGSQLNPPGDPDQGTPDYASWTLADLRAEAARRGIENRAKLGKDELVAALS